MRKRVHTIVLHEHFLIDHGLDILETVSQIIDTCMEWAYIRHDKDLDKVTGVLKPPHYHILMRHANGREGSAVVNDLNRRIQGLNLPSGSIQEVHNFRGACAYLTHRTSKAQKDEKYLYDVSEVISNMEDVDFSEWSESDQVDYLKIFSQDHFLACEAAYKKECGSFTSLMQFSTFIRTYQAVRDIRSKEKF